MTRSMLRVLLVAAAATGALAEVVLGGAAHAAEGSRHRIAAERVAAMVGDSEAIALAGRHKLDVVNVMWEDTGRFYGSSVGPNISDVTIEVEVKDGLGKQTYLMPVMRHPNFSDKTGDVDIDSFFVKVGNHHEGGTLEAITLRQLLANPYRYMSRPDRGKIKGGSLLARRDDKVLVSAQSAFLPIPHQRAARFYPVIFNYQSSEKHPAVLTILVTRQGTSMTVIDNARDTVTGGDSWGQRLYLNAAGKRAPLSAERLADVKATGVTQNGEAAASLGDDANVMMIIQVPLKLKAPPALAMPTEMAMGSGAGAASSDPAKAASRRGGSDMDVAVLGHGPTDGPFTELGGLTIERDARFPIRVTVQFYQATSSGVVSSADMRHIAGQIRKVYKKADYVGSLVLDADTPRPTRWDGATFAPLGLSWTDFPGLVERYYRFGEYGVRFYAEAFRW